MAHHTDDGGDTRSPDVSKQQGGQDTNLATNPQDAAQRAESLPKGTSEEQATRQAAADTPGGKPSKVPDTPADLKSISWKFTFKNAWRQFNTDQCTDLSAALTYYLVQAIFPALLAIISLLGIFGKGQTTVNTILDIIKQFAPSAASDQLKSVIQNMVGAKGSGFALVIGILAAVWSASGYVGAFGRALNRIYSVPEGRSTIKLRLTNFVLTVVLLLMASAVLLSLAVSGGLTTALFSHLGIGHFGQVLYSILKWPVVLIVVVLMVAMLYNVSPNLKQAKFQWLSIGGVVAVVTWIVVSLLFGLYVSHFGNYNKTYGTLGGVIVMLLWLWITNIALLLGAEVDSEIVRARQLQAGIPAEKNLVIPLKDDKGALKKEEQAAKAEEEGREIRLQAKQGPTRPKGKGTPKKGVELDDDGFVVDEDSDD